MFRARFIASCAAIALVPALAGCSGSTLSTYLPDWLTFKPPPPPTQALQFETQPPGADVRTAQGQTCRTPCSLAVPVANQSVTFALNGFVPQTMQVEVSQSGELAPNPVQATLQEVPRPVKPVRKPPKTATRRAAPPPPAAQAPPPAASPFPPPPPQQR